MLLLAADVAARAQGSHIVTLPGLEVVKGLFFAAYSSWMRARTAYLGLSMWFLTNACVVLILCLCCFWIELGRIKLVPNTAGKGSDDVEVGIPEDFPMVKSRLWEWSSSALAGHLPLDVGARGSVTGSRMS
ncbi:probable xyloglucan glycosyltransferase 1 isoform X2 [Triticum dicoccoides]|uniref:probable xyloglucan glycosyltransferase 1 isoform X2 n=1 Tax=Triticum dicoccoides TaxID=85692 RepID=UPI00188EE0B2|nr:probable xyloglucan glycosyltransferase 1 isoform X2 [Triticum dicoccoides]